MNVENLVKKYFEEKKKNSKNAPLDIEEIIYLDMKEYSENLKTVMPLILGLKVTDRCNFSCSHCFVGDKKNYDMSMKQIEKIISNFQENRLYRIYLTGGEPFLNPDIVNIIKYIKEKNISLSIHTNASMINDTIVECLKECFGDKDYLQVSIDAADSDFFYKIRGGKLQKVIANCQKLTVNRIDFIVNTVVTNKNIMCLEEIYRLSEKLGAKEISFSPLMDMHNDKTCYLPNDDELLKAFAKVLNYHFSKGSPLKIKQDPLPVPWGNNILKKYFKKTTLICPAGKTQIEIDMCILRSPADVDAFQSGRYANTTDAPKRIILS